MSEAYKGPTDWCLLVHWVTFTLCVDTHVQCTLHIIGIAFVPATTAEVRTKTTFTKITKTSSVPDDDEAVYDAILMMQYQSQLLMQRIPNI